MVKSNYINPKDNYGHLICANTVAHVYLQYVLPFGLRH